MLRYILIVLISLISIHTYSEEIYFGKVLTEFTITQSFSKRQMKKIKDIKVVLPLAKEVKYLYTSEQLSKKELTSKYEAKLKKLSWSQGRLFIKLINRECDETAYTIIKQYFNKRTAVLSQSMAWIVGFNLNSKCDEELDNLCLMIENKQI